MTWLIGQVRTKADLLIGTCYLSEGELKPPTENRGGRELVGPSRKVVKVWNSGYGERKWSR